MYILENKLTWSQLQVIAMLGRHRQPYIGGTIIYVPAWPWALKSQDHTEEEAMALYTYAIAKLLLVIPKHKRVVLALNKTGIAEQEPHIFALDLAFFLRPRKFGHDVLKSALSMEWEIPNYDHSASTILRFTMVNAWPRAARMLTLTIAEVERINALLSHYEQLVARVTAQDWR